ncbi:MAG: hypothetical protein ACC652_03970 [Acidimicrobiales bacterium]
MKMQDHADIHRVLISPNAAQRNDMRKTPRNALSLRSIARERRAAFGRNSMITGAKKPDQVTGRRPRILRRPYLTQRTRGIDFYL